MTKFALYLLIAGSILGLVFIALLLHAIYTYDKLGKHEEAGYLTIGLVYAIIFEILFIGTLWSNY